MDVIAAAGVFLAGTTTGDFATCAVTLAGAFCFVLFTAGTAASGAVLYDAAALETIVLSGGMLAVFTSPLGFVLSSRNGVVDGRGPNKNCNRQT